MQQVTLLQIKNFPGVHQSMYQKMHLLQFFHIFTATSNCLTLQILSILKLTKYIISSSP